MEVFLRFLLCLFVMLELGCTNPSKMVQQNNMQDSLVSPLGCEPSDTITVAGTFVKYKTQNGYYTPVVGNHDVSIELGFSYDCSISPAYVAQLSYANKNFVLLSRGCGSWCNIFSVVNLTNPPSIQEYSNIVALDTVGERLASVNFDTLVVYSFSGKVIRRFNFDYPCDIFMECIQTVSFNYDTLAVAFIDERKVFKVLPR